LYKNNLLNNRPDNHQEMIQYLDKVQVKDKDFIQMFFKTIKNISTSKNKVYPKLKQNHSKLLIKNRRITNLEILSLKQ
jgi:hypothetical protein